MHANQFSIDASKYTEVYMKNLSRWLSDSLAMRCEIQGPNPYVVVDEALDHCFPLYRFVVLPQVTLKRALSDSTSPEAKRSLKEFIAEVDAQFNGDSSEF